MAGGLACFERKPADADDVAVTNRDVRAWGATFRRDDRASAGALPKQARACHVVGVHVGLDDVSEGEAELFEQLQVAVDLLAHRIDQRRGA